jgi:hypothetical protein
MRVVFHVQGHLYMSVVDGVEGPKIQSDSGTHFSKNSFTKKVQR